MSATGNSSLAPFDVLRSWPRHDFTLHDAFKSRFGDDPDREFIRYEAQSLSWAKVDRLIDVAEGYLTEWGIGAGDRVAIMGQNSPWHVVLLLALSKMKGIMVPVNPNFNASEAGYAFAHSDVSAILCSAVCADVVQEACAQKAIEPLCATYDVDVEGFHEFGKKSHKRLSQGSAEADDNCIIVYTSGSTGFPKGVLHSQRSFLLAGEAFVERMHLQRDDRLLIVLPMFHINALFYSVSGAIASGCAIIIVPKFSASQFWQQVAETGATEVNVIEAIGSILAQRSRSEYRSDHSMTKAYGVRANVAELFRQEFGVKDIISGYGLTEVPGVLSPPFGEVGKTGSMGKLGRHPDPDHPWSQCRIIDEEGQDVSDEQVGELAVRSPIIMQGYFRDEEATEKAFRDGWFLTGDYVRRDSDGYFYFVSRKKDIIRRRGENISAAEIERILTDHPAVAEAAAIAVPAPLGEDDILVAVVRKAGIDLTALEIVEWCQSHLSAAKVPRYVAFTEALPKTATQKISKQELRNDSALLAGAQDFAES